MLSIGDGYGWHKYYEKTVGIDRHNNDASSSLKADKVTEAVDIHVSMVSVLDRQDAENRAHNWKLTSKDANILFLLYT